MSSTIVTLLLLAAAPRAAELSYERALETALVHNPSLIQAEAGLLSAEGGLVSARGTFDPYLSLGGDHQTSISESFSQLGQVASETSRNGFNTTLSQYLPTGTSLGVDWSVDSSTYLYELLESGMTWEVEDPQRFSTLSASISQSLLQGHRMAYNLQAVHEAQRSLSRAEANLVAARLQAVADTATAYWNLHTMREFEAIASQALAVAEEEGRVVQAMVDAGQLAPVEATRVEAAVVQARSALIEASHAHRVASESLAQLLGSDPAELIRASSSPEPPVALSLDDGQVVDAALAGNPEILVYRSAVESAEIAVANAKHARLPELAVSAAAGVNGYDPSFTEAFSEMFTGDLRFWSVGADFSVPLGNRADRGWVLQAEASLTQARQQLETMERYVAAQVLAQVRNVEAGLIQVELAEANLRLAQATLDAEKAKQREGRAIQKDVLEAQRALSNAQANLVLARTGYVLALVELGRLQGRIEGVAS
jgi:outer membrane protein